MCVTGGVLAIIVGVLGLWAANRGVTISITVLGSFAVIVAVIGTIVDGIAAAVIGDLASCLDIKSGEVYGDTDVIYAAAISGCLSSYYYNPNELSCICVDRSISSCYDYELADPNGTCEIIFTSYITNLKASTAFGAIVTILSFVISVIACVDGCSTASSQVHDGSVVLQQVPTIVIAQDIHQKPQAAVVYATAA